MTQSKLTIDEMEQLFNEVFPQMHIPERVFFIEHLAFKESHIRLKYTPKNVRPGGTLSGPSMMTLADYALYAAILASIGSVTLAVTTNLSFNFLRKPLQKDLIAKCKLLKLGKRLAVGEVMMFSEGDDEPVCHATGTYSIPTH